MKRKAGAFTIIELAMILLVIGILAAVAITLAPDMQAIRTTQAAYKIKSDIRYAQSYALASQKMVRIDFDPSAESYRLYVEQAPGSWVLIADPLTHKSFIVDFTESTYKGVDISNTNFDGAGNDLAFDAAGVPYSYAGTATALSTQGSVSLAGGVTVMVKQNTGKVSIQ